MICPIKKNLTLIGKTIIKPEKSFSFNAFLLTGEKNILIDTVPEKASEVFWQEVTSILPIESLDAVILNHSEEDHSGALPYLLTLRPDIPVYCTSACAERLCKIYPQTVNWMIVKTGDKLELGREMTFSFYETPGLHWDDNMVTYWKNEKILFSNDLFGQSIGLEVPLDKEVALSDLENATKGYYHKVLLNATEEENQVIQQLEGLPVEYIAPGHGVVISEKIKEMKNWYKDLILNTI